MHPSSTESRADEASRPSPVLGDASAVVSSTGGVASAAPSSTSPRVGAREDVALSSGAVAADAATLYRYASVRARRDCPSAAELIADGWTVEHVDERYGTKLMKRIEE